MAKPGEYIIFSVNFFSNFKGIAFRGLSKAMKPKSLFVEVSVHNRQKGICRGLGNNEFVTAIAGLSSDLGNFEGNNKKFRY
jgi:hypothetical protein